MIVFVHYGRVEWLPPLLSLLHLVSERGEKVAFLALSYTETTEDLLKEFPIDVYYSDNLIAPFLKAPFKKLWLRLTGFVRPYLLRAWAWRWIDRLEKTNPDIVLWSIEMPSAAILGNRTLAYGRRHVISLYELGDERGRSYCGFDMERVFHSASIIECESNRARILKEEKGLPFMPFVLPNKPYPHPRKIRLHVSDPAASSVVASWGTKRVILYQGAVQSDRQGLLALLDILCRSFPSGIVAVMSHVADGLLELKARHANFSLVPYVAPPYHLEVTSHAHIGVAYYERSAAWGFSSLNSVYCAPNKIFEYAGFGLPMIGSDIPGLRSTIGDYEAGICLSDISLSSVSLALDQICAGYDRYASGARRLFESVDLHRIVSEALEYARQGGKKE